MDNYYETKLNSQKLFQVYETGILRVRQYLSAEIDFVKESLTGGERVLELGAGYGRIIRELAPFCGSIVGIDISKENVEIGKEYLKNNSNASMVSMDVHKLSFKESFDVVLCMQNGLSAMKISEEDIRQIIGYVAPGGRAYFSTYSSTFWDCRIQWFKEQAQKGLLGELDMEQTKDGVIVCKDGFRAMTHSVKEFEEIGRTCGYAYEVEEVDQSSLFLVIHKSVLS